MERGRDVHQCVSGGHQWLSFEASTCRSISHSNGGISGRSRSSAPTIRKRMMRWLASRTSIPCPRRSLRSLGEKPRPSSGLEAERQ